MANTHFRYTKQPARPEIIHRHIRERVEKELDIVGKSHVAERNEIVRDFENKPEFEYRIRTTKKELRLEVYVTNADTPLKHGDWTIGELWNALDKTGVKRHAMGPITPKGKGYPLRFKVGGKYQAKTKPGGKFRGPGKVVGGKWVATYRVKKFTHPGFKPRKFTERINKELRRLFLTQAERGYRLGHQEALFRYR